MIGHVWYKKQYGTLFFHGYYWQKCKLDELTLENIGKDFSPDRIQFF